MQSLLAFLLALPELIPIYKEIRDAIREGKTIKRIQDDRKKIRQAFKDKDAKALNDIFNS